MVSMGFTLRPFTPGCSASLVAISPLFLGPRWRRLRPPSEMLIGFGVLFVIVVGMCLSSPLYFRLPDGFIGGGALFAACLDDAAAAALAFATFFCF